MDKAQRQAQLLLCARDVFAERGYHATSVSDIIELAGVARGTFYLYFESKRAVFEQLVDTLLVRIESAIRRVEAEAGPDSILQALRGNAQRVFQVLTDEPGLTRILLHEAVGLDPGFDAKLGEFYGRLVQFIAESIELGEQMGWIRPLDRVAVARFILGGIKETLYDGQLAHDPEALRRVAEEMIRYIFHGIADPATLPG